MTIDCYECVQLNSSFSLQRTGGTKIRRPTTRGRCHEIVPTTWTSIRTFQPLKQTLLVKPLATTLVARRDGLILGKVGETNRTLLRTDVLQVDQRVGPLQLGYLVRRPRNLIPRRKEFVPGNQVREEGDGEREGEGRDDDAPAGAGVIVNEKASGDVGEGRVETGSRDPRRLLRSSVVSHPQQEREGGAIRTHATDSLCSMDTVQERGSVDRGYFLLWTLPRVSWRGERALVWINVLWFANCSSLTRSKKLVERSLLPGG